jgi:hypothetical protein
MFHGDIGDLFKPKDGPTPPHALSEGSDNKSDTIVDS